MAESLAYIPEVAAQIKLLDAWIEGQMAYAEQPGLSIAAVYDQQLVWARGFGWADVARKTPAAPETLYRIASITKLFTATALMQLRDAGKLQLDDPLAKHLPWFRLKDVPADERAITLRHLITHTSGMPREAGFPYWTDLRFPTREQLKENVPTRPAIMPVETRWKYSNLALALAGEVVMAASGRAFAEYVREKILNPLGMERTFVDSPAPDDLRLARAYGRRLPGKPREDAPFTDTAGIAPAANMTTCVTDLARFAMLQFRDGPVGGAQILSGASLREMQRIHWLEPDWQAGWGLGFRIERTEGKTWIGHGGAVRGYRTHLHLCPADKVAFAVFTNSDDGNAAQYTAKAAKWLAPALVKAARLEEPAPAADPAWTAYEGRYRNAWGDVQVLVLNGELVLLDPSQPDPLPTLVKLLPVAPQSFKMEAKAGFLSHGERCIFELDGHGKVVRAKVGEGYTYPVNEW
ncbi:MAG: serine hydrolase [Planctomycetes bacterium]|nr:serine hydrolase [Planctomycetota bacterium]